MMNQNHYKPYPTWFEKYGPNLEKFPHSNYLKTRILDNIKWYKENILTKEKRLCQNCQRDYITLKKSLTNCPFCNAPKDYNIDKIGDWINK